MVKKLIGYLLTNKLAVNILLKCIQITCMTDPVKSTLREINLNIVLHAGKKI